MTRQRQYQLRNKALGRCGNCPQPICAASTIYCARHHAKRLEQLERLSNAKADYSAAFWSKVLDQFAR